MAELIIK